MTSTIFVYKGISWPDSVIIDESLGITSVSMRIITVMKVMMTKIG